MLPFIAILLFLMPALPKGICRDICQTKECKEAASRVLESMDTTIAPCNDFYEFACKGWIKKHPIPVGEKQSWNFGLIGDKVNKNLEAILVAPDIKKDGKPLKQARALYRTCINRTNSAESELKPICNMLAKLGLTREPPTDIEAESLDIPTIVGRARRFMELNIFVKARVSQNQKDSTMNDLKMSRGTLTFNSVEKYRRDPSGYKAAEKRQREQAKKTMQLLGAGDRSEKYANELTDFMIQLANILNKPGDKRSGSSTTKRMTINQLQSYTEPPAKAWNWTRYMNGLLEQTDVTLNPGQDKVVIIDGPYFKAMSQLLSKTSPGTIARFIWWEGVANLPPYYPIEFRHLISQLDEATDRRRLTSSRMVLCIHTVKVYFGMAMTAAYVERHFTADEQKRALKMWTDVSKTFDEMLSEVDWMDDGTKAHAHKKLATMRHFIGFPEWVSNPKKLESYYKGFEVLEGKLFETVMNFIVILGRETLNEWKRRPDKNRWIDSGVNVNAFYSWIANSVTIPAVMLHTPLYGNGVEALNYGGIGAILGHELTHGFDVDGRIFDGDGNNRNWWTSGTLQHFLKKVDCMIKQYNGYAVKQSGANYKVNGVSTQGENIADNGGLREAFRAYQKLKARNKSQQGLPGLGEFTDEQLFFLGFAQMWCGSYSDEGLKHLLANEAHAPGRFRTIGSLQNNAEFAKAWKCPRGSPMNPKHKCVVW